MVAVYPSGYVELSNFQNFDTIKMTSEHGWTSHLKLLIFVVPFILQKTFPDLSAPGNPPFVFLFVCFVLFFTNIRLGGGISLSVSNYAIG